jgi:hypothetical protein
MKRDHGSFAGVVSRQSAPKSQVVASKPESDFLIARGFTGDWRDPEAYHHLRECERSAFAWEWLRRAPEYCAQALEQLDSRQRHGVQEDGALPWNLHAFEDPRLPAHIARPVWTAAGHSWVLAARAWQTSEAAKDSEFEQLSHLIKIIRSPKGEHVLFSDGAKSIRLDVTGCSLIGPGVRLSFELAGVRKLDHQLIILRRLQSLFVRGTFSSTLNPPICRARRLIAMLRAFDAVRSGATQAEIASVILRPKLELHRWRVHSPSLRSQAQRLVQCASRFAGGAFWMLLN